MGNYTDLLYARPSLLEGIGRLFDVSGVLNEYNSLSSEMEADTAALHSDWYAMGEDAKKAMDVLGKRLAESRR